MSTSNGHSVGIGDYFSYGWGSTYLANYGFPIIERPNGPKSIVVTYTFNVYKCDYVVGGISVGAGLTVGNEWKKNLSGLKYLGSVTVKLTHSIE